MPRYIVKLVDKNQNKDYYLIWSTVVDAPVSDGVGLTEFEQLYRNEYGKAGEGEYRNRMRRVNEKGTSSMIDDNAEDVIRGNRAGPGECALSYNEIVRFYCLGEKMNEEHPCWKQRMDEFCRRVQADEDTNSEEICEKFPYTVL